MVRDTRKCFRHFHDKGEGGEKLTQTKQMNESKYCTIDASSGTRHKKMPSTFSRQRGGRGKIDTDKTNERIEILYY